MNEGIKEGDAVLAQLMADYSVRGVIVHVPLNEWDAYRLETSDGMLCQFRQYIFMMKL